MGRFQVLTETYSQYSSTGSGSFATARDWPGVADQQDLPNGTLSPQPLRWQPQQLVWVHAKTQLAAC